MNKDAPQYRILIVDDEPDTTLTLKLALEGSGFASVDTYNDPLLALAAFKPATYDILLLDVRMHNMDGFELYKKIHKIDENAKVCFITAYETYYDPLKREFPGLNVGCFISKPIDTDGLINRLKMELQS